MKLQMSVLVRYDVIILKKYKKNPPNIMSPEEKNP